jgi:Ca2+-binding EF-hand superfamily protein
MINAINGLGSSPYIQTSQRLDPTESLFEQIDANQDKSLDQNELKTFTDTLSPKTGLSMSVYDIISKLDTNGDGRLGQEEFDAGRPNRPSAGGVDSLFAKIDANGDGSLDKSELNAFVQSLSNSTGGSPTAEDLISKLDTDGNGLISQKEFEAGRPEGRRHHGMGGADDLMGMQSDNGNDNSSSSLDPLDTNGDGVVDAQELEAAGLNMLTQNYMNLIDGMFGIQEQNQGLVDLSA